MCLIIFKNNSYDKKIFSLIHANTFILFLGISLRKVEKGQQREVEKSRMDGLHDVASILARRVAMEFSDSESGSESGSGSDWDDETSA